MVRGGAHGDRRSVYERSGAMAHEGGPGFQRRQEKSMKSYVRNPMKARSSRWAAAKERFGQLQERSKLCERLVARCAQFCSHTFGGS